MILVHMLDDSCEFASNQSGIVFFIIGVFIFSQFRVRNACAVSLSISNDSAMVSKVRMSFGSPE